jgi:hypothetical protein
VAALLTSVDMTAQRHGSAVHQGREDSLLLVTDPATPRVHEVVEVGPDNVGHLEGAPTHCEHTSVSDGELVEGALCGQQLLVGDVDVV